MKRLRWKRAAAVALIILAILTGGAYWAMNRAVDKVLHAVSTDSLIGSMASPSPASTPQTSASSSTASIPPTQPTNQSSSQPAASPVVASSSTSHATAASSPPATPAPYKAEIDTDKAEKAQEEITLKDKLDVTSIFLKRFSAKELDAFSKLASGGLSLEEKVEAKKIVLEKLSEEEYNQLIAIAAKLGLSQGKNYEDSTKEFIE